MPMNASVLGVVVGLLLAMMLSSVAIADEKKWVIVVIPVDDQGRGMHHEVYRHTLSGWEQVEANVLKSAREKYEGAVRISVNKMSPGHCGFLYANKKGQYFFSTSNETREGAEKERATKEKEGGYTFPGGVLCAK